MEPDLPMSSHTHIPVSGPLTFATVPELLAQSRRWWSEGASELELDLSAVTRADSAGIALLLELLAQARQGGVQLRLTGLPDQLVQLVRANGVEQLLLGNAGQ